MSSYWAGYAGTGMLLSQNEFDSFLEKYKEKNPGQEYLEEYMEDYSLDETLFVMSKFAGTPVPDLQNNEDGKYSSITMDFAELNDDRVEGVMFWPFVKKNSEMNTTYMESTLPLYDTGDDTCYFLFSDNDLCNPEVFEKPAYASYDAFVQEFKDKMEQYMPEDFNWNAHLGYLSYAAFA